MINGMAEGPMAIALPAVIVVMGLATLLGAIRIMRGPTLPDRVVALDLIGTLAVGSTGIYAILEGEAVYITVSLVLAILMFVGTVAFAYYLKRVSPEPPQPLPSGEGSAPESGLGAAERPPFAVDDETPELPSPRGPGG